MTRSELLEKAIALSRFNLEWLTKRAVESTSYNEQLEAEQFTLDLLLAEKKREAGCDKCNDPKILEIQIETGFDYCPHCGRSLTEGESV